MSLVLRFLFVFFISLSLSGLTLAESVPRMVFAHYVVCCSTHGFESTVEDYKREIISAKKVGIDGFSLNCGHWLEEGYRERALRIYAAAEEVGDFKLFISLDQKAVYDFDKVLDDVRKLGPQLLIGGRPVISTFGGQNEIAAGFDLTNKIKAAGAFFIPYYYPYPDLTETPNEKQMAEIVLDNLSADGFFYFGAAGSPSELIDSSRAMALASHRYNKIYMAGVTPYYRGVRENYRVFDGPGLEGFARQWISAIESKADLIQIVTWNDWDESTYVAPFGDINDVNLWDGHFGSVMLSHAGFLKSIQYFSYWFKHGIPPVMDEDFIVYSYRLHFVSVPAPRSALDEKLEFPKGVGKLRDRLYFSVFLKQSARVRACISGVCKNFKFLPGISHAQVGLRAGIPIFYVYRQGRLVGVKKLEMPVTPKDSRSRFNYFSGWSVLGD